MFMSSIHLNNNKNLFYKYILMNYGILKFRHIDGSIIGEKKNILGGSKEEEIKENIFNKNKMEYYFETLPYIYTHTPIENIEILDNLVCKFKDELEKLEPEIEIVMNSDKNYYKEEIVPLIEFIKLKQKKQVLFDSDISHTHEYIETIIEKVINFKKHFEVFKIKKDKENEEIKKVENEIKFSKHYKRKKKFFKSTTTEELDINDIIKPKEEPKKKEQKNEPLKEEQKKEEQKKEEQKKEEPLKEEPIKGGKKEKDTRKKIEEEYFTEESLLITIDKNKINDLEQELNNYDTKDKKYKNLKCKIYSLKNKKKISKRRKLNNKNGITKIERLNNLS